MEKVYHVLYGCFDLKPGWAKTLEKNYMESKQMRYTKQSGNSHPERDKGCFELMACDAKSEIVHTLQRVGKVSSHGYYISLQMPKNKNGKRTQRVFGKFYNEMIKNVSGNSVDINDLNSNDDELSFNDDHNSNVTCVVS